MTANKTVSQRLTLQESNSAAAFIITLTGQGMGSSVFNTPGEEHYSVSPFMAIVFRAGKDLKDNVNTSATVIRNRRGIHNTTFIYECLFSEAEGVEG